LSCTQPLLGALPSRSTTFQRVSRVAAIPGVCKTSTRETTPVRVWPDAPPRI